MINDSVVNALVLKELDRHRRGIELIASENYVSNQVMQAMGSVLTNKYAEDQKYSNNLKNKVCF